MDKKNFEKDINVPSKRSDRIDKMEIDLANYEQMERDIEKIIEPYQLDWELDCLSLPNAIQSILERKEQELQEAMDNYVKLDNQRVKEYNELVDRYTAKEQECEELIRRTTKIFACLIKANRNEIADTLWVDDILNGEDLGVVLFVSGCDHNCYNCQNPQTHNFNSGILFDEKAKQEIFEQLEKDYIHRITYSGGCPLCGPNRSEITKLAKEIKTKYPKIKQWCYCGEKFEEVKHLEVLKYIDVLVDGKFVQELADVNYPFAGSTNQRVIDVKKSLRQGEVVLWRSK